MRVTRSTAPVQDVEVRGVTPVTDVPGVPPSPVRPPETGGIDPSPNQGPAIDIP
jgi:hypothetical protein